MLDYTFNGVPTRQMALADIEDCLRDGISVNDADGLPDHIAQERIMERLRIELVIRRIQP